MKIKVGIIGCGSICEQRHAPEYKMNESAEIAAFCDPAPGRAARLAERFGGEAFTDYRDMLVSAGLDAVSVCTANSTHALITIDALKSGKHVLCEKPMATCLDDAAAMIEASRKSGRTLMVGHNQRLLRGHMLAKEILSSGKLGRILSFKTCFGHGGPEMWSVDKGRHTWFFKKGSAHMGAVGDLGIHKADLIRWLIDDEIDEVCAFLGTRDKRDDQNEYIDVEDNAACIMKSKSGILGSMHASWTYYGEEDNSTVCYCEKGIMKIFSDPEYQIRVVLKDGDKIDYKTETIQTNDSQSRSGIIDAFVSSIINGTAPEISGIEGYEALSIALACMESCSSKKFIKVGHFGK